MTTQPMGEVDSMYRSSIRDGDFAVENSQLRRGVGGDLARLIDEPSQCENRTIIATQRGKSYKRSIEEKACFKLVSQANLQ